MAMNDTISHGAVVVREYGIPAVVGGKSRVSTTGQPTTANGTAGTVRSEVAVL